MKGFLKFIAAMIPCVAASVALAAGRGNEIVGTGHDFSSKDWAGRQVCLPCHTPHHAMPNSVSGRLWNHALTTASFTVNQSGTTTIPNQPTDIALDRASKLCMSCHDGVTALDAYGNHSSTEGSATGSINIGTDLSNDHPVGLFAIYDSERQHSGHYSYQTEATVSAAGLSLQTAAIAYARMADPADASGRTYLKNPDGTWQIQIKNNQKVVGCTTCHNPHGGVDYYVPNADGTSTTVAKKYLLRADPRTICTSCHTK